MTFKLVNTSSFHYRFEWPEPLAEGEPAQTDFSFAPRVGHVHAGKTKAITCTFNCSTAVAHDAVELAATLARIEYREPKPTPAEGDDPLPETASPQSAGGGDSDVRVAKEVEVGGRIGRGAGEEGNIEPAPEPPEPSRRIPAARDEDGDGPRRRCRDSSRRRSQSRAGTVPSRTIGQRR